MYRWSKAYFAWFTKPSLSYLLFCLLRVSYVGPPSGTWCCNLTNPFVVLCLIMHHRVSQHFCSGWITQAWEPRCRDSRKELLPLWNATDPVISHMFLTVEHRENNIMPSTCLKTFFSVQDSFRSLSLSLCMSFWEYHTMYYISIPLSTFSNFYLSSV